MYRSTVYFFITLFIFLISFQSISIAQPTCNGLTATIFGTESDDTINGTSGADVIAGLGGNDTIHGKQGNDVICGGDGNDNITGDLGQDTIFGDAGDDVIDGNQEDDVIKGGLGNDDISGGEGKDTIDGEDGNDIIEGNQRDDTLTGGLGDDTIKGGTGNDNIDAGDGNNIVEGNSGIDVITTGSGDDVIKGGEGADTINSGAGADTIESNQKDDIINSGPGNDIIDAGTGNDIVNAGDGDDHITGKAGGDILNGEAGNDTIIANVGNDTLDGASGNDTLDGGGGSDTCINGETNINCEDITGGNNPPVADAGPDQSVFVNDNVQLDGTGSSDPDGDPIIFNWSILSQPQDSTATLSDPNISQPTITIDEFGDYVIELFVNDGTIDSPVDSVTISTLNSPPVANAGPDQAITVPSTVQLDGSASNDVDGDLLTYSWTLISIPANSTATLSDANIVNPTFNADLPGTYEIQLIVNDGTVDGDPDTVLITTDNIAPIADAGLDQTVLVNDTVNLDGSGSSDGDNDPLTFSWTIISSPQGSTVTLVNPNTVNPSFIVDLPGDYVIQLIVNDGTVDSDPVTVVISTDNSKPVADAGPDQTVPANSTVQLDGTGSFDVDMDPITFEWSLISVPNNSTASLSDNTVSSPTFDVDKPGTYIAQLIVDDGTVKSDPDTVVITRENNVPVLDAVGDKTIDLGNTLTINLSGSDSDNDEISFSADPLPLPEGASLDSETGVFSFTPNINQVGDISLSFIVTDTELSNSEAITITVQSVVASGNTTLTGRVLDANDATNGIDTPIVNATVTILNSGTSTTTDAQGNFTLENLPGGNEVFVIDATSANTAPDGSPYASFSEALDLIVDVVNNVERPFYLPRIDISSSTTVDPAITTIVTNSNLGVSLEIPPNSAENPDGTPFTGEITISNVPPEFAPAPLPGSLQPGLLVTIQPINVSFTTPAPITFPNFDNLAPGSEVDIWSLDPDTGEFAVVGIGQVSTDGSVIETISGGIVQTDWHFPIPPAPPGNSPLQDPPCENCCTVDTGSSTSLATGNLSEEHSLVSYNSLNQDRTLNLEYNSTFADPRPIIQVDSRILQRAAVPNTASISLVVAGVEQNTEVFTDTSGFSENMDEEFVQAIQIDASSLVTGVYDFNAILTSNYDLSSVSNLVTGDVMVNNLSGSNFGSGWSIKGLSRLHINNDGSALIDEGDGDLWHFRSTITNIGELSPPASPGATVGTGLQFDTETFTALPLSPNNPMESLPFTIEAWVRPSLRTDGSIKSHVISNDIPNGSGQGFGVNVSPTDSIFRYEYKEEGFSNNFGAFRTVPNVSFNADEWHHVALVYTTGNVKAYFDGNLVDDFNFVQGTQNGDSIRIRIGKHNSSGSSSDNFYMGILDEVRVWSRIRTLNEIRDDMSRQISGAEPGLELYYRFDEGAGTTVFDLSPNGWDGSLGATGNPPVPSIDWVTFGLASNQSGDVEFTSPPRDYSTLVKNPDDTFTRTMKDGTQINFNSVGLQTSIVDRNGNTTTYQYDANDKLTKIIDPVGLETTFTYVGDKLSTVTDPASRTTTFEHDAAGNLTKITDPDLTFREFSYDSNHKLITQKSKRGFITTYQYDHAGRNIGALRPDGSSRSVSSQWSSTLADISSGLGSETNPAPVIKPDEVLATFSDGNGNIKEYKINEFGFIVEVNDDLNRTSFTTRDVNNNITQSVDLSGDITDMTYDTTGNLLTTTNQSISATTTFTYTTDGFNNVKTIKDPNNNTTTFNYDANGNLTSTVDALTNPTTNTFNSFGQITSVTDALNNVISFNYDPISQNLVGTTDQLNNSTTLTLDAAGNVITSQDRLNRISTTEYDSMNKIIKTIDPDLGETNYTYDDAGNLTSVTDSNTNVTSFTYDELSRVSGKTDPLSNLESISYDLHGNLTSTTDRKGQTITYNYDAGNRLTSKVLPGGLTTTYVYDESNNITSIIDPDSSLIMTYDGGNRLSSVSTNNSPSQPSVNITYSYDSAGNLTTLSDSVLGNNTYSYDSNNLLTSLSNPSSLSITYDYDALNRPTLRTYPNGVTTAYQYNARGDLTNLDNLNGITTISSFDYTPDDEGKIIALDQVRSSASVNGHIDYQYDNLDRLIDGTNQISSDPNETYSYDSVGNRLSETGQTTNSIYNAVSQLLEDQNFTYVYDLNGNLVQKTDKTTSDITDYTYDAENRLVQVDKGGVISSYKYDGLGRRIEKNEAGNITRYVYRDIFRNSAIIHVYDGSNTLEANYTHSFDIDNPLIVEISGSEYFYLTDKLGSVTEIVNSSGTIEKDYTYNSFGNILDENGTLENLYSFTGRELETDDLYYYRERYYDANTGRFINEDPIGVLGNRVCFSSITRSGSNSACIQPLIKINHPYSYVESDPINNVDPFGLFGSKPGANSPHKDFQLCINTYYTTTIGSNPCACICKSSSDFECCEKECKKCVGAKKGTKQSICECLCRLAAPFGGGDEGNKRNCKVSCAPFK